MLYQSQPPITGTILVADDQAANRELLEELLTAQGFKVITVTDGAALLQELTRVPIDLILLDVMMPHLSGFEVCQKVKSNPDTYLIPVILITALSDKQDRVAGIKVGADDFLSRPVDRTELLARVRSLLTLKYRTDNNAAAEVLINVSTSTNSVTITQNFAASPTSRVANSVTPPALAGLRNPSSAIAKLPAVLTPPPSSAEVPATCPPTNQAARAANTVTPA